jgi:tetratricopeptide (TPR) repeat protein
MAIKGSLSEASLADVVQLLALGFKTGALSVTDRSRFGQIFFDRGRISYARIVNRRDRLGDLLVHKGLITSAQLADVLAKQARAPERRLGELLVEQGLIEADTLAHTITEQIEEAILHLFTWSQGSFFFEAGARPETAETTVSLNAESLLLEAARRIDEWSLIEKKIPSLDVVFSADRERIAAANAELTPEQQTVVRLTDGTRSVQEVVDASGLTEFATGKALFGLLQAGYAMPVGRRAETPSKTKDTERAERHNLGMAFFRTGMLTDAAQEFERVLELAPGDLGARYHLALIALRERRYRDAVRGLMAIVEEKGGADFASFMNLSVALRSLGRNEEALLALDEAHKLRPDAPDIALARGVIHLSAYHVQDAGAQFVEYRRRLATGQAPAEQFFYYAALTSALAGDAGRAELLVTEGLSHHPQSAPLLLFGGLVHERRGDYDGAERMYRRALETDATLPQAHKNLGDIAYERGAYDEALQHYQRVSEMAPELGDDLYAKLGNLHYRARNREGAIRHWRRALELNPANPTVRNNLELVGHGAS